MALSFALQVDQFVRNAKLAPDIVVRKVALGIHRDIVMGTPVDTGRARASWGVGLNRYELVEADITDKSGTQTILRAAARLNTYRPGDSVWIGSGLPYMERLEFGWSRQAPAGMHELARRQVEWMREHSSAEATGGRLLIAEITRDSILVRDAGRIGGGE